MKKVVLSLAVLFSVALVSCNANKSEANDSDTAVAACEETCTESIVLDSQLVDSPAIVDSVK